MDDFTTTLERWGIEPGYHDVFGRWHAANAETVGHLIEAMSAGGRAPASPDAAGDVLQAFQGEDDRRLWVLAIQLYSLRSGRNWGHGDFGDLKRVVVVAAAAGAAGVGLNPLHALFADRPEDASPY